MAKGIFVIAEQREGALRKVSFELVSTARKLADQASEEVCAVLLGSGIEGLAAELGKFGADKVFVADNAALEPYITEAHAQVVAKILKDNDAAVALFAASVQGKDLSARVAAKLAGGLATDCTDVKVDGGKFVAVRPMYAGKCFGEVAFNSTPAMASLRPNVFPAVENAKAGAVTKVDAAVDAVKSKVLEVQKDTSGKVDLTEATIIVSGGRGMKGPDEYKILEELAYVLKGTVGASRAAVDAGWRPQKDQVGQTGKVVSPNLYIACGISGAIQHLAGMSSSKCIAAINKDEEAPIFAKADFGVVDDLFKVVPELTAVCKKMLA